MKKILYLMIAAVMVFSIASCGNSTQTDATAPAEETELMVWQTVDSTTSHINLSDSACITMQITDSAVVFGTQGIDTFKVYTDSVEVGKVTDSGTYEVPLFEINGRTAKIQADTTELEIEIE
jgi:hypothetical protein